MSTDNKDNENLDLGTQVPQSGENASRQTNLSSQDTNERNEENSRKDDKDSNGEREIKSRTFNENEDSWESKKQEGATENSKNAGSGAGYGHNSDDEAFESDRKM